MYVVYNSKFIKEVESSGKLVNLVLLELAADSVEDLPAPNAEEGQIMSMGSIGYVIDIGAFYVLNSSGEWLPQNGGSSSQDETTPEETTPDAEEEENNG